jgi:hypothetical protein
MHVCVIKMILQRLYYKTTMSLFDPQLNIDCYQ